MERNKIIIKTSIQGIAVNIVLVVFKAIIGAIVNSIAIILDAVNNLSDAISSIITIIGTKLAGKAPDKEHPYGHGRIEYFAALIISIIVLLAGLASLKESVVKIINPVKAEYSIASIIIIIVATIVKFFFGRYVKNVGQRINSQSLIASGTDAFMDSIVSFSTLIAAIISIRFGISIEAYLGLIIAVIIIKSSMEIMKQTINTMIGERADSTLTETLRSKINEMPEVQGVYDITLHNYGPSEIIGSLHIQVDDNMKAKQIHALTRKIQTKIFSELGIILTVGIYASNNSEEKYVQIKNELLKITKTYKEILQMHGFYVDEEQKMVSFDIIVDFDEKDKEKIKEGVIKQIKEKYPEYDYIVILDSDYSDRATETDGWLLTIGTFLQSQHKI